jgi:hypothetical protein
VDREGRDERGLVGKGAKRRDERMTRGGERGYGDGSGQEDVKEERRGEGGRKEEGFGVWWREVASTHTKRFFVESKHSNTFFMILHIQNGSLLNPHIQTMYLLILAVRCGAVRCGAMRCGAVRCGAVRCGAVCAMRCGAVRCHAVRCGGVRGGAVRCGAVRCGAVRNRIRDQDFQGSSGICTELMFLQFVEDCTKVC